MEKDQITLIQQLQAVRISNDPLTVQLLKPSQKHLESLHQFIRKEMGFRMEEGFQQIKAQQRSQEWFKARSLRLTASNFSQIVKKKENLRAKLAKDTVFSTPRQVSIHSKAIDYGVYNQAKARQAYSSLHQLRVEEKGLCYLKKRPWIAASPDGLVYNKQDKLIGLIQIKCIYSQKNQNFDEREALFMKKIDGVWSVDRAHKYFYQIQGQLLVFGLPWCDLVVYTEKGIKVYRVERDEEFIDGLGTRLDSFFWEYMSCGLLQRMEQLESEGLWRMYKFQQVRSKVID